MSCPETPSVFSIRVPKTRRERPQRRQTQRLLEYEDVLMSSRKTAMSSHEVIRVSPPNTLLSYPKYTAVLPQDTCVFPQDIDVSSHKTSKSIMALIPIFYTFLLIVHCKTRCISRLIMDHPCISGLITSPSMKIFLKKRSELSESSVQTLVKKRKELKDIRDILCNVCEHKLL